MSARKEVIGHFLVLIGIVFIFITSFAPRLGWWTAGNLVDFEIFCYIIGIIFVCFGLTNQQFAQIEKRLNNLEQQKKI
jgi:uncharacterized membrane protein